MKYWVVALCVVLSRSVVLLEGVRESGHGHNRSSVEVAPTRELLQLWGWSYSLKDPLSAWGLVIAQGRSCPGSFVLVKLPLVNTIDLSCYRRVFQDRPRACTFFLDFTCKRPTRFRVG